MLTLGWKHVDGKTPLACNTEGGTVMSYASRGITAILLLLLMGAELYGDPGDPVENAVAALLKLLPFQ